MLNVCLHQRLKFLGSRKVGFQTRERFLSVFLVSRQALLSASSLSLLKGMCTCLVCRLWVAYIQYDCIFCWRDQRAVIGGSLTLCHRSLCHNLRWVFASSATPMTQTGAAACIGLCVDLGDRVQSKVWSLSILGLHVILEFQ